MCTLTLVTCQQEKHAAEGYLSMGKTSHDGEPIQLNSNIVIMYSILKIVAVSVAEAKFGALFVNTKVA